MVALSRLSRLPQKTWRRILLTANVALAAGIVLLVVWAVAGGPVPQPPAPPRPKADLDHPDANQQNIQPLSHYIAAASVPLRKPLVDAPPPPPAPASTPVRSAPSLRVRLVGIAEDADAAYGVFVDSSGQEVVVAVGEIVDNAELLSVEDEAVTMKYRNEQVRLELPEPSEVAPPPDAPEAPEANEAREAIRRRRVIRRPSAQPPIPMPPNGEEPLQ